MSTTTMATNSPWVPQDTFGLRLRILRAELGLSVDEITARCGLASATWSTWEHGTRPLSLDRVVNAIYKATGCDRDWLMWGGPLDATKNRCLSDTCRSEYVELAFDFEAYGEQTADDYDMSSRLVPCGHAA